MNSATATAHPNIALVKYWGKRDENLILPVAGSLSLTLDAFETITTVSPNPQLEADEFMLNDSRQSGNALNRVTKFLDLVRELSGHQVYSSVVSTNLAPTGAGLASSASGFAALAVASAAAYGCSLNQPELSRLARRGSGSASRSLVSGVAVWHAGVDDETSFAEQVAAPDMHMTIVTVNAAEKAISSRQAMRSTALTSPYYPSWITSTEESLKSMLDACAAGDFTRIGRITETHAMRMHAVIEACDPPIRYLSPTSVAVFDRVAQLRSKGIEAYATADAGPNVAIISRPEDSAAVAASVAEFGAVRTVGPGPGAHLSTPPKSHTVAR